MRVRSTPLAGVLVIEPPRFRDARGRFLEAFHAERYAAAGVPGPFVQDNVSWSDPGVLRGLHLQHPNGQGKLVQVLRGAVWDVAVDVRVGSPTFGRWVGEELSDENGRQLYIPPGFAHGFLVTGDEAVVAYKCTMYYDPSSELVLRWDDPDLGVAWPEAPRVVGDRDRAGGSLAAALARGVLPDVAAAGVTTGLGDAVRRGGHAAPAIAPSWGDESLNPRGRPD